VETEPSEKPGFLTNGLHLFALLGFSVAQPLFYLLARYAGFFAAHQATPSEILILILTPVVILPAVAWALEFVALLVAVRLQWGLHLLLVSILVALFTLPGLKAVPYLPGVLIVMLAASLGGVSALAYARYRVVRSFVTLLALAPLVFVGTFVFKKPVYRLLFRVPVDAPQIVPNKVEAQAPIVMIIFDDLSLTSLMDEHRQIDPIRYPAFAALAKQSTWFRNTSTVQERTHLAVPAILTGRYPTHGSLLPIAGDYPLNLFTMLRGSYRMNVHESVTALYQEAANRDQPGQGGLLARLRGFYSDLWIVYLHVILPEDFASRLPPLVETWKDFAATVKSASKAPGSARPRSRSEMFYEFLESITRCEGPCLHFLHVVLPHPPWEYLPSGKMYQPNTVFGMNSSFWGAEEWLVAQGYQRHLLQVEFVDKLMGELLSRLNSIGMYDRSLIVVTADHGRNFWPAERYRNLNGVRHPEGILGVPLLIKAPDQRAAVVSDRNVETIDILPTIADLLGIHIPWPVDGCSALAKSCPERSEKVAVTSRGKRVRFGADILLREESLKRKLALFGSNTRGATSFTIGPYRDLIGRKITEFEVRSGLDAGVLSPLEAQLAKTVNPDIFVPARVAAFFHSGEKVDGTPYVAISVNGTIHAVAPALPDKKGRLVLSAMLPEEAVQGDDNDFQFFVVKGLKEKPELYRISYR